MSPQRGWFESEDDYRQRVAEEANERTIENSTGEAPSRGWFENENNYRERISQEANERRIEDSTGDTPSQGWFESEDSYRARIEQKANECTIEDSSGLAPSQGWLEGSDEYNTRVRREANERIIKDSTGSAPERGWFEEDHEFRSRVAHSAREVRADNESNTFDTKGSNSGSYSSDNSASYSTAKSDTSSDYSNSIFVVVIVIVGFIIAVFSMHERQPATSDAQAIQGQVSSSAKQINLAPENIILQGVCPYESCKYDERWLAKKDVDLYFAPPEIVGVSIKSLQKKGVVHKGDWITTVTGIILSTRGEGRIDIKNHTAENKIPLKDGEIISIYGSGSEGCYFTYVVDKQFVVCDLGEEMFRAPKIEWWIKVKTADGVEAWVNSAKEAFVREDDF